MPRRKKGVPAPEGPDVFTHHGEDKGQTLPLVLGGKRIGTIRMAGVKAPRDLDDAGYCGDPPKGDAA